MTSRSKRPIGLNLRPGRAAKARKAAGLSLRALAAGQISANALHLIERGESRPTLSTLRLIAKGTGQPIEYFLAPGQSASLAGELQRERRNELEEVEVALSQERFPDVVNLVAQMLDGMSPGHDRALAQFYAAQAHIRQAQPELARPLLEAAMSHFEAQTDASMVVECLDWYAAILHVEEDPEALPTARKALRLASELRPLRTRTLVRIWGRIGAISVSQHKWKAAIEAYQKAVDVGGDLLDLSRMAKMYNDLSIAYRCMNRIDEARSSAIRSIEVHELLNDRLSIGRAETNLALILLRDGRPLDAQQRLVRALGIFIETKQDHGRSIIHLALSESALSQGNLDEAVSQATDALVLAESLNERASLADAHELLARIFAARKDWSACDREFNAAILILEDLGVPERVARIHALYAKNLESQGKSAKARLHWRRAVEAEHPDLTHDVSEPPTAAQSRSARLGKASKSA
jgi:tetratricopeptide (TPR) repeat protein